MSGRRYGVAVRPLRRLLAMHVLHDPALVRPTATLEADLRDGTPSPEELNLACTLNLPEHRGPSGTSRHDHAIFLPFPPHSKIGQTRIFRGQTEPPLFG